MIGTHFTFLTSISVYDYSAVLHNRQLAEYLPILNWHADQFYLMCLASGICYRMCSQRHCYVHDPSNITFLKWDMWSAVYKSSNYVRFSTFTLGLNIQHFHIGSLAECLVLLPFYLDGRRIPSNHPQYDECLFNLSCADILATVPRTVVSHTQNYKL